MATFRTIQRETSALTGTTSWSIPSTSKLQITLGNPLTVTGGSLVFRGKATATSAFEAITGDDTIACGTPLTLTIENNRLIELECVSTATGTASAVVLDIVAWD